MNCYRYGERGLDERTLLKKDSIQFSYHSEFIPINSKRDRDNNSTTKITTFLEKGSKRLRSHYIAQILAISF